MKNQDYNPQNQNESESHSGSNTGAFRRLMALLTRAKIDDASRHDLVYAWTKGRTCSSKELTPEELRDLAWKFENHFDAPSVTLYVEVECKRLRSIVLKIATETGIKEPDNFISFNRFMLSHSILKKELRFYTIEELHQLVKQFRGLEANYRNSATQPGTKAYYHSMHIPQPVNN